MPLGDAYLELIAVVDEDEAAQSVLGRWVAHAATETGVPIGWCVRPTDLAKTALRLHLEPQAGSRARPNGEVIHWRTVGVDEAFAEPALPFFIERLSGDFPGAIDDAPPPAVVTHIELEVDPGRIAAWLGPHELPLEVTSGTGRLRRVVLTGSRGEIRFDADGS